MRPPPPLAVRPHVLGRFRDLRKSDDDFGFSSSKYGEDEKPKPSKVLTDLLREGPNFGIHFPLREGTEVLYKTTDYYAPTAERSIRWDDPDLRIAWPADAAPLLSDKDAAAPLLRDAVTFA